MPLADLNLTVALKFTFEKTVTGWANIVQGENSVTETLSGVDLTVWNQAYVAKLSLAGGADTTVDLRSFTNLAGEAAVALAHGFGVIIQVDPDVTADDDCSVTVEPGASNGLVWNMADVTVGANQTYAMTYPAGETAGVTIDATHKTLLFDNTGTDPCTVTVVILGGT